MDKQTLLTGWNFMRFLRLGLGIYIAVQAVETLSFLSGIVAVFFLFQAITNTGCCGSNGCAIPINNAKHDTNKEVKFEEIK